MMAKTQSAVTEVKRVSKFGVVGVINTLLDFAIYNILHFQLGLGAPIPANLVSTTVAMLFSFAANKRVVFNQKQGSVVRQAAIFFAVTAFGLYVLQNGVILLLKEVWTGPLELAVRIAQFFGLTAFLSPDFITENGAKAAGTVFSMTWNYLLYKRVVFNK